MSKLLLDGERIFAASVSMSFNVMGSGVSYLIGPIVVPFDEDLDNVAGNGTEIQETRS